VNLWPKRLASLWITERKRVEQQKQKFILRLQKGAQKGADAGEAGGVGQ